MKPISYFSGILLTAILFCFTFTNQSIQAQPANNTPCGATAIECGEPVTTSTDDATVSGIGSPICSPAGSNEDLFYSITIYPGNNYNIAVGGLNYDGVLVLYTGQCNSLVEFDCKDAGYEDGIAEIINFDYAIGEPIQTIFIRTYDYNLGAGGFSLMVSCTTLNDNPEDATPINCGETLIGSNRYAEESGFPNQSCEGGAGSHADVFYSFTAMPGVNYQILNNGIIDGTNYDGVLTAYSGTLGSDLVELACSDIPGSNAQEEINLTVNEPTDILIRTFDWSTTTGSFAISLNCTNLNDTPCNAVLLSCGNTYQGTTRSATATLIDDGSICAVGSNPGVFFKLETIPYHSYIITVTGAANFDPAISGYLSSSTCNDFDGFEYAVCAYANSSNGSSEETSINFTGTLEYYFEIYNESGNEGEFEIEIECIPQFDCLDLIADFNDPCNDGDPDTNNDRITEDCTCEGNSPCISSILYANIDLTGTNEIISIGDCNWPGDYNAINNVFEGDQYTFTTTDDSGIEPLYITVRSGSVDGPVLGMGYSPLTVTSDIDGSLFAHLTANEFCETTTLGCSVSSVQCLTCDYDCPSIGAYYGDSCDDGNADTVQDAINEDCLCEGVIPPTNNLCGNATTLVVNNPGECPANQVVGTTIGASHDGGEFSCDDGGEWVDVYYTFNSGDFNTVRIDLDFITQTDIVIEVLTSCSESSILCEFAFSFLEFTVAPNTDYIIRTGPNLAFSSPGTFGICISGIYECPLLEANIGDPCNDGDPSTINDEVQADCTCVGELTGDASLSGSADWNTDCSSRPMEIALYNTGTSTHIATIGFDINADGTFATSMDYLGTFDIYIKIDGYLRKGFYNYVIAPGGNIINVGAITPGDLNGDNGVNIVDFSILSNAFGSSVGDANYNFLSDLNCDGGVNIVDFSMLSASFGMGGATP